RAIAAGLVDEWNLFLSPVVVGGGTSAFPAGSSVELVHERVDLVVGFGPVEVAVRVGDVPIE
ncbi:MAG: dihydrofolate reductase family protein, partial [Actinomycetota bacterium]